MENWRELLLEAERALVSGRLGEALQCCDRASFLSGEARHRASLMRGRILLEIGDPLGALSAFESIARLEICDPEVDCARGVAHFELAQFPEAEAALRAAIRADPSLADGYYTLGLISEFLGTGEENHWFREARKIDPERFAPVCQLTNEEFQSIIEEAVSGMDEQFQDVLEQLPIVVAELPLVNDLHQLDPRISPLSLAMMVGAITEENSEERIQPVLFLFKRNVERAFRNRAEMVSATRAAIIGNFADALGLGPP